MLDPPLRFLQRVLQRRCLRAAVWRCALIRRLLAVAWLSSIALVSGLIGWSNPGARAQEVPEFSTPSQPRQTGADRFDAVVPPIFAPPQGHDDKPPPPQWLNLPSTETAEYPPAAVEVVVPADSEPSPGAPLATDICSHDCWEWQLLPDGLIYRSYLAGFKEPRLHSLWAYEQDLGWVWDIALGGRVGILRYGDYNDAMPDGWQIDLEGAGFPRLDPEEERDLVAVDFRAGVPITYGAGPHRTKIAYYHLSSHLGDEFLLKNPTVTRYNYSRDVLVLGQSYYLTPDWRIYGEAGWAFYSDVSGEWEFQFGVDYSPIANWGCRGSPFAAFNGHLREEVDFGGNLVAQVGWQWRQPRSGHLFRLGVEYYNGKSDQFEFFNSYENKIGLALWYDY